MANLKGKKAVVTGASRGIGKACVARLLQDGVDEIAMIARTPERLEKAAAEFDSDRVFPVVCDVGSLEQVEQAFRKIYERFGRIDILVNNAGVTRDTMFHKMSLQQWEDVINTDLNSLFYCCKQVVNQMRAQEYGKIVNLSSVSAYGNAGQCNYSAAKAAIQGFTRTLAKESARKNITVNAVLPCFIDSDMVRAIPENILQERIKEIPMQRLGKDTELAAVVSFLCSDDCSFMTGQSIIVDGGMLTL